MALVCRFYGPNHRGAGFGTGRCGGSVLMRTVTPSAGRKPWPLPPILAPYCDECWMARERHIAWNMENRLFDPFRK